MNPTGLLSMLNTTAGNNAEGPKLGRPSKKMAVFSNQASSSSSSSISRGGRSKGFAVTAKSREKASIAIANLLVSKEYIAACAADAAAKLQQHHQQNKSENDNVGEAVAGGDEEEL